MTPRLSARAVLPILLMSLALGGCLSGSHNLVPESFSSDDTFSRSYPLPPAQACEAARRALLSQGYTVAVARADAVEGSKNFQPKDEVHEQLSVRISCAAEEQQGSWVFVSAVLDRYSVKKNPTSASVGVGGIGSVSLPIRASDDSLVRVASVTLQDADFYSAFFDRVDQFLPRTKPRPAAEAARGSDPSAATATSAPAPPQPAPPPVRSPRPQTSAASPRPEAAD